MPGISTKVLQVFKVTHAVGYPKKMKTRQRTIQSCARLTEFIIESEDVPRYCFRRWIWLLKGDSKRRNTAGLVDRNGSTKKEDGKTQSNLTVDLWSNLSKQNKTTTKTTRLKVAKARP